MYTWIQAELSSLARTPTRLSLTSAALRYVPLALPPGTMLPGMHYTMALSAATGTQGTRARTSDLHYWCMLPLKYRLTYLYLLWQALSRRRACHG